MRSVAWPFSLIPMSFAKSLIPNPCARRWATCPRQPAPEVHSYGRRPSRCGARRHSRSCRAGAGPQTCALGGRGCRAFAAVRHCCLFIEYHSSDLIHIRNGSINRSPITRGTALLRANQRWNYTAEGAAQRVPAPSPTDPQIIISRIWHSYDLNIAARLVCERLIITGRGHCARSTWHTAF